MTLNVVHVDGYRKFCNKLWNATRFALMKLGEHFVPSTDAALTGHESLAERWILHRLNVAARNVSAALTDMNFMAATTAVHSFWLHELCDVYIEYIKPITTPDADAAARHSAQQTLSTCLDQGLKLLHPFMPFVTEELWQRLPRRASETSPSISVSAYPEPRSDYENSQAESEFELIMSITKAGRSLTADYNVLSKSTFFISNANNASHALVSAQFDGIVTLIKGCQSATSLAPEESVPAGCALVSVSDEVVIHLLVRGQVDINQEIGKIEKKTKVPNYETNVPEEVRNTNASKIGDYKAEINVLQKAIETFLTLKGSS